LKREDLQATPFHGVEGHLVMRNNKTGLEMVYIAGIGKAI
jgi:hypothetical protein